MRIRAPLLPVALSLLVHAAAASQSCVIAPSAATGTTLQPATIRADTTLVVTMRLLSAPAYLEPVPMEIGGGNACRVHVTPPTGTTSFRVVLRPELTATPVAPAGTQALRLQIVAADSGEIRVRMNPLDLKAGQTGNADIVLQPLSSGAREYSLEMVVTRGDSVYRRPFSLLWAPMPRLTLRSSRTSCGLDVCLMEGRTQELEVSGDVAELKMSDEAQLAYVLDGNVMPQPANWPYRRVLTTDDGQHRIRLNPPIQAGVHRIGFSLPLLVKRLTSSGGPITHYIDTVAARVETAPPMAATLSYAQGGELSVLRGGSNGVKVRLASETMRLAVRSKYQLRELTMGAQGTPVAEFYVDRVSGDTLALGTLVPVAPTRTRTGRDGPPELVLPIGTDEYRIPLSVLPRTRVDRFYVLRTRGEQLGGTLRPLEKVRLRLEGAAVRYLEKGKFGGRDVTPRPIGGRDSVEVDLLVPRNARATEMLHLWDFDGDEIVVPITIEPEHRPKKEVSEYLRLVYQNEDKPDTILLLTGVQSKSIPALRGVKLRIDPSQIDEPDTLYGVQYLQVDVELYDAKGNAQGRESRCIAIVPPPVGDRDYPLRGNCTRVANGEFAISDLVERSRRATAKSTMYIRVRHDQAQYPDQDVGGEVREVALAKSGWFVFEPRLQLPGPVMAFHRGRTTAGLAYAGALLSWEPVIGENVLPGSGYTFGFQGGFIIGTAPSGSSNTSDALTARLSLAGGAAVRFRNMAGDVDLDFFGGRVYPISGRGIRNSDAYWVFRPGFSIPVGGGQGSGK